MNDVQREAVMCLLAACEVPLRDVAIGFGVLNDYSLARGAAQTVTATKDPTSSARAAAQDFLTAWHDEGSLDEADVSSDDMDEYDALLDLEIAIGVWMKPLVAQRAMFNKASQRIVDAIVDVFDRFKPPLTVRQVYYQLASSGLVPLSKSGYRKGQRLLLRVRELGLVPWSDFADRARKRSAPSQWSDLSAFADTINGAYRKDLWQSQPDYVEFWLEKDALSAFVSDALNEWGNPLCVIRGFSSATFVHEGAVALQRIAKPKFIYYLGDHDPAGLSIEANVRERLTEFGADFHFERLAIDLDDIETHKLRPLFITNNDSRRKKYEAKFGTTTIELDALPPDVLRDRIRGAVQKHIDPEAWRRAQRTEQIEIDHATRIFGRFEALRLGGAP